MITDIGNIIIDKIKDVPFADKYAGVVKTIVYNDKALNGSTIKKSFPADCRMSLSACQSGSQYLDLCPDTSKKSVMYFEDAGTRLIKREGNYLYWSASLDLVAWINMPKIGFNGCSYAGIAIMSIIKQLPVRPFNQGDYHMIEIDFIGEKPKNQNPFSKYSYDEAIDQFLMYPFDYFVLALQVNFRMDLRCLDIQSISPEIVCLTGS